MPHHTPVDIFSMLKSKGRDLWVLKAGAGERALKGTQILGWDGQSSRTSLLSCHRGASRSRHPIIDCLDQQSDRSCALNFERIDSPELRVMEGCERPNPAVVDKEHV